MPVYEFLCEDCKTVFNFYSSSIDTETVPCCPRCTSGKMKRQFSVFSTQGKSEEYSENALCNAFEKLIDSVEEEKAENLAVKLMQFAEDSGVAFKENVGEDIEKYIDGDQSEGLKKKLANYLRLDSCTFNKGDVFIEKAGGLYLFDEKLYDLKKG